MFTPNGVAKQGDKGSETLKPGPPVETWARGASVEVAWGIRFNVRSFCLCNKLPSSFAFILLLPAGTDTMLSHMCSTVGELPALMLRVLLLQPVAAVLRTILSYNACLYAREKGADTSIAYALLPSL